MSSPPKNDAPAGSGPAGGGAKGDPAAVRQGMREIDFVLNSCWRLGKTIVAGWCPQGSKVSFCFSESYNILGKAEAMPRLIRGKRMMGPRTFAEACKTLRARPMEMEVPFTIGTGRGEVNPLMIENLVRRYAVAATAARAAILFDIVSFSKHTPLEQVAQLSSLEYSINSAVKRLNQIGLRTELARSTVGDGFYVWNRAKGLEADIRTWLALTLILADNALARQKGDPRLVPTLRAAFALGAHFSYHQVEGNSPRGFEYIVGDVTITLARIIAKALPGQVLVGQFTRGSGVLTGQNTEVDTLGFLARAERGAAKFTELELGHQPILSLRTGITAAPEVGRAGTTIYQIKDKHGFTHQAFNVRVMFERDGADTLAVGLQGSELAGFGATPAAYQMKLPQAAR